MTEYSYTKAGVDESKLQAEIVAVGLPVDHIAGGAANLIVIYMTRDLLPGEKTILDNTVASHDGRPRGKRPIISIYTDLGSLSINQRTAIWSNLTAGTPPLWTLDLGPNAATLYSFRFQATTGSLTVAERNDAQRWAVAMYCQDNPKYLVAPTFDPTINVAGDQVGGVRGLLPEDQAVINQLFKALRPTPLQSTVVSDRTLTAATSLVLWNQWQITNFEPFVLRGPGRYQMEGLRQCAVHQGRPVPGQLHHAGHRGGGQGPGDHLPLELRHRLSSVGVRAHRRPGTPHLPPGTGSIHAHSLAHWERLGWPEQR
jgi:hypothetical protein